MRVSTSIGLKNLKARCIQALYLAIDHLLVCPSTILETHLYRLLVLQVITIPRQLPICKVGIHYEESQCLNGITRDTLLFNRLLTMLINSTEAYSPTKTDIKLPIDYTIRI